MNFNFIFAGIEVVLSDFSMRKVTAGQNDQTPISV